MNTLKILFRGISYLHVIMHNDTFVAIFLNLHYNFCDFWLIDVLFEHKYREKTNKNTKKKKNRRISLTVSKNALLTTIHAWRVWPTFQLLYIGRKQRFQGTNWEKILLTLRQNVSNIGDTKKFDFTFRKYWPIRGEWGGRGVSALMDEHTSLLFKVDCQSQDVIAIFLSLQINYSQSIIIFF